jgi:hypothetical protein
LSPVEPIGSIVPVQEKLVFKLNIGPPASWAPSKGPLTDFSNSNPALPGRAGPGRGSSRSEPPWRRHLS